MFDVHEYNNFEFLNTSGLTEQSEEDLEEYTGASLFDVSILIVDDLYSTGATLNEVCKILKQDKNVGNIYCLVMTKTKG